MGLFRLREMMHLPKYEMAGVGKGFPPATFALVHVICTTLVQYIMLFEAHAKTACFADCSRGFKSYNYLSIKAFYGA